MADDENTAPDLNNEKLFDSGDDWWQNAMLLKIGDQWSVYAHGYKVAADRLVDSIDNDRFEVDFIVYPVVFLYRQSIELYLKNIIKGSRGLLEMEISFPKHHDIYKLWIDAKGLIVQIWPDNPEVDFTRIEGFIKQFSGYDPSSEIFRYPEDRKGNPVEINVKHINLRNLQNIMEELIGLLDGASTGISHYIDEKGSMNDYYAP